MCVAIVGYVIQYAERIPSVTHLIATAMATAAIIIAAPVTAVTIIIAIAVTTAIAVIVPVAVSVTAARSEERRGGKECL